MCSVHFCIPLLYYLFRILLLMFAFKTIGFALTLMYRRQYKCKTIWRVKTLAYEPLHHIIVGYTRLSLKLSLFPIKIDTRMHNVPTPRHHRKKLKCQNYERILYWFSQFTKNILAPSKICYGLRTSLSFLFWFHDHIWKLWITEWYSQLHLSFKVTFYQRQYHHMRKIHN